MGELGAFLKIHRVGFDKRDPRSRVGDYKQYFALQPEPELRRQGARCMDCGVPFCHEGCPLGNLIPDWNDLVYRDKWRDAIEQLHATNNFPEFTGLICPAPCESACVLAINDDPVTIEQIELAIIERAFSEGWVVPRAAGPPHRAGRWPWSAPGRPGLAVAAELNRCGHTVTVFERDEGPGGLLRFGVPDAKLEKWIIDRRVEILEQEGIEFVYNTDVGPRHHRRGAATSATTRSSSRSAAASRATSTAPGRELAGIHSAMDYLYQRNRWVAAQEGRPSRARARHRDHRRGQEGDRDRRRRHRDGLHLELPPRGRAQRRHARRLRRARADGARPPRSVAAAAQAHASTYALDEGGKRRWGTEVTGFGGKDGRGQPRVRAPGDRHLVARPHAGAGQRVRAGGRPRADRDRLRAPRARGPGRAGSASSSTAAATSRTEQTYRTSVGGVYACGDARIGQSLVVTAIAEGRKCARVVNADLGGSPMDADRERLAVGAWSGEADQTLRHEAEAAGRCAGRGVLHRPGQPRTVSANVASGG